MVQSQATQELGRAMNALQDYLIRKLLIPKIYLDAEWNGVPVQVLAIDRAGVGDVHAMWMFYLYRSTDSRAASLLLASKLPGAIEELSSLSDAVAEITSRQDRGHYLYIAVVSDDPNMCDFRPADEVVRKSLADDGVGRVGVLFVDLAEGEPSVRVILKAERFRSSRKIVELADQFVAENPPNWEVRE